MRLHRTAAITLRVLLVSSLLGWGLGALTPAHADHTPDDLACPATHCVNAADLAHGDINNLAEDAGFERTRATALPGSPSWPDRGAAPAWIVSNASQSVVCHTGTRCATRLGNGVSTSGTLTNATKAEAHAGDAFIAEGYLKRDGNANGTGGVQLTWYGAAPPGQTGPVLRTDRVTTALSTTYTLARVKGIAPSGAAVVTAAFVVLNQTAGVWTADTMRFERALNRDEQNYTFGFGLLGGFIPVVGDTVRVDTTRVQRRVTTACPSGLALVAIAENGTATCRAGDGVAFYAFRDAVHAICNTMCTEATLGPLPAGTWAVSAKEIVAQDNTSEEDVYTECKLNLGPDSDLARVFMQGQDVGSRFVDAAPGGTLSMQVIGTITAPTKVGLACGDNNRGEMRGSTIKITAIPVGGQNRTPLP